MTLNKIAKWQQAARPANEADISLALGIFLEEVAEVVNEFAETATSHHYLHISELHHALIRYSFQVKNGRTQVKTDSRANLTKELADVVVTAVGLGHTLDLDVPLACERVNRSNWSKFVDGMPLYNDHGKVIKGPDYVSADMTGCY